MIGVASIGIALVLSCRKSPNRGAIVCQSTPFHLYVKKKCKHLLEDFYRAPWWCRNAHVQIALTFLIPQDPFEFKRQEIPLPDGGTVSLDWSAQPESNPDIPIVVICHGLTGSSADMRSFCLVAFQQGFRPVVFNKRGHGDTKLTTPRLQPFGEIQDFEHALKAIEKQYPNAKKVGVGFSAGAGLLVSYLGEKNHQTILQAGVAISPGYDAFRLFCSDGIMPIYNRLMTMSVKSLLKRHEQTLSEIIDFKRLSRATTLQQIDELSYMQFHGAETIQEYWVENNPMRQIHDVQVPVLCINALDDPVCTSKMIPYELFQTHPNIMLVTTEHGSHCGFYRGQYDSWAHFAAVEYLQAFLNFS